MKAYMKPQIEVEVYQLQQDIAQNCHIVVHMGPSEGGHPVCEDYKPPFMSMNTYAAKRPVNVSFFEDTNCDCYYSATNGQYFTS